MYEKKLKTRFLFKKKDLLIFFIKITETRLKMETRLNFFLKGVFKSTRLKMETTVRRDEEI